MPEAKPARKRKGARVEFRADEEEYKAFRKKARSFGWTPAAVFRALMRLWSDESVIDPAEVRRKIGRDHPEDD